MTRKQALSDTEALELAAREAGQQKFVLRLYIAGTTARSQQALRMVSDICEHELAGRCELEVIDLYQQPTLARGEQIIAAPTLIRRLPAPLRKVIGSMADKERLLVGLDIKPKKV